MAIVYGYGPEFAGALIQMEGDGTEENDKGNVLSIPAGVGPFTIPDRALKELPSLDDPNAIDPVTTYPRAGGGSVLGLTMFPLMPDTKRLGKFTLPAGQVNTVRAYLDGLGTSPVGDPRVKGALTNAAGAVVATTNEIVLGRNNLLQTVSFAQNGATFTTNPDGSQRVVLGGGQLEEGAIIADRGGWSGSPGEQYTFIMEARATAGAPQIKFQSRTADQGGTNQGISTDSSVMTLTPNWTKYVYTFTVPAGARISRVSPKIITAVQAAGVMELRNFMGVRGPAPSYFYLDRPTGGWYDLPLIVPTTIAAGDYYLGVQVGSDIAPATLNTPSTLQTQINGTAEVNTTGWNANGTGVTLARDTAVKKSGAASFKLTLNNASTGDNFTYDSGAVSLVPGDRVTIEAWANPSVTTQITPAAYGAQYNGSGTFVSCPAGVWTKITHTFTSDFTASVGPYMRSNTSGATLTINYDNITVRVQKANASTLSSGRMAGSSVLGDLNLITNPKGSVDTASWSGQTAGTGATAAVVRVTGQDATPWSTTGIRYTLTAGSTTASGELTSDPFAQKFEPGSTVNMVVALQANANCALVFGLNGIDATGNDYVSVGRSSVNAVAGRWYYLQANFTVPANAFSLYPVIGMDSSTPVAAGASRTMTLAFAQVTANPNNAQPPLLDPDMPGNFWDGTIGASTSRGPEARVNWVPDPRTTTNANWGANGVSRASVVDSTSPTGLSMQVSNNTTGGDFFITPALWPGIDNLYFPALPGETWTLSGWVKQNASALVIAQAMQSSNPNDYHQQASLWFRGGTPDIVALPGATGRPQFADTWTPFAITATVPALTRSGFIRLHNTSTSGAGPVTSYAGLKLERGTWTADSYFDGTQSGCNFHGTVDNSSSIKWQNPDQGDLYSDGVAAMQATVPVQAAFNKELGVQVIYQTP